MTVKTEWESPVGSELTPEDAPEASIMATGHDRTSYNVRRIWLLP